MICRIAAIFSLIILGSGVTLYAQSGPGGIGTTDGTSELVLWLDAGAGTSTTTDGVSLSSWNDQSGYGHNASASGVRQPTFYSTTFSINSQPVIRFDGDLSGGGANGDRLTITDTNDLDDSSEWTYFVVARPTTLDGNPRGTISKRISSSSNEAYSQFFWTSNYLNTDIATNPRISTNPNAFSASTAYILSTVFDNPNLNVYSDASEVASATNQTTDVPNTTADLLIGQLGGNSSGYFAGDIAEVIVYNRALSHAEQYAVERYLESKYGNALTTAFFAYNGTYGNDVRGIDNVIDTDTSSILTIDVNAFDAGEELFFGHDGDAASLIDPGSTNLPIGNNRVLDRVWRLDPSAEIDLDFKIDVSGLTLNAGESFRLLVMDSFDGSDYSGADQYAGVLDSDTLSVSGITINSDVFIGLGRVSQEANTTFYSFVTGNWQSAGTWTNDPSGISQVPVGGQVPGDGSGVVILNGRTVSIAAADTAKDQVSLEIEGGAVLDLTTNTAAHSFGNTTGEGLLRLSSVTFPSGNFTGFLGTSGGTVEYYDVTGTLPASPATYNNLEISDSGANTVTLGNSASVLGNLSVTGSATFSMDQDLSVDGDVSIESGATWQVSTTAAMRQITVEGDVTVEGTIDFINGSGEANLEFTGTQDSDMSLGASSGTQLNVLTVNKGVDQTFVVHVFAASGASFAIDETSGNRVEVQNGTLRLGSNIDLPDGFNNGGNYDMSTDQTVNGALWIDGATVDMTNANALVVYGLFRISSGSIDIGAQGLVPREEGEILIEGGTVNASKFRVSATVATHRGSFTMSGGTFNIDNAFGSSNAAYAAFNLPYSTQSFTMSGGTINVTYAQNGGTADDGGIQIGCDPANISVTGGTWVITIPTNTNFGIASSAPFWNLQIEADAATYDAIVQDIPFQFGTVSAGTLEVLNNLTITSANTPTLDLNGYDAEFGNDLTVNTGASLVNGGAENTVTFNQNASQTFTLNSNITLDNVVFGTGNNMTLAGTGDLTVQNDLTITADTLNDAGVNIDLNGNLSISGVVTGGGTISLTGGSATHTIGGNGSGVLSNLELDDATYDAQLTADVDISGTLTFTNGEFNIGEHNLSLGTTASISGAGSGNRIIGSGSATDGGLTKRFTSAGGSFTFPLGSGAIYTPATLNVTDADGSAGTITVVPVSEEHPNVAVSGSSLTYYWKVSSTGFGSTPVVTHSYTYDDADVVGTEADYVYGIFDIGSVSWSSGANTDVDESTNVIGGTGTGLASINTIGGDFTAGEVASFGAITIFYARADGDWNTATTWSNAGHGGAAAATTPGGSDIVFIGDGGSNNYTISVADVDNAQAITLGIASGSVLDLQASTGNNLGTVVEGDGGSGFGRIRLSSGTFPGGNLNNFLQAGAGTVEYYRNASDFTVPSSPVAYNNLGFSTEDGAAGTITLPATDLTIRGNLTIGTSANNAALDVETDAAAGRNIDINGALSIDGSGSGASDFILMSGGNHQLDIDGSISIGTNGSFSVENAGSNTHVINLLGNLVNSGSLEWSTANSTATINLVSDDVNQSLSGAGATYNLHAISVDKGSNQFLEAEIDAANLSISGSVALSNGTLRFSNSQDVVLANNSGFNIPTTARLLIDGPNLDITGTGFLTLNGKLQLESGTLDIGDSNQNNYLQYAPAGSPEIEINGGTLTVNSQLRRNTSTATGDLVYSQSAGTVIVGAQQAPTNTRGVFELVNNASFTMSGGTIEIVRAQSSSSDGTTAALLLEPSSTSINGGTIRIGNASTPASATIRINSAVSLFDVEINTTNSPTARLITRPLSLTNDLTIEAGATLQANNLDVSVGGDWTNSGTYTPGNNLTTFSGSSANLTGSTSFYDFTYSSSGTLTLASSITVSNDMEITSGTIADGGNTITLQGDLTHNGTHSGTGNFLFQGLSQQTVSGDDTGVFGDVEINNAAGVTFNADFDISASNTLTLSSGILNIGANHLDILNTSAAAISGTFSSARMITTNGSSSDDGIRKSFAAGAADFTFPVGTINDYTPARFDINANGSAGTITVRPVSNTPAAATDDNGDGNDLLSYFWNITSTGFSGLTVIHYYTYVEADVQNEGASTSDADYDAGRFASSSWTSGTTVLGSVDDTANEISIDGGTDASNNGVSFLDGIYTAGALEEFGTLATYYSRNSATNITTTGASWTDAATWSTTGHAGAAAASPPSGNVVIVADGHIVNVSTNSQSAASLTLNGTAELSLGSSIGHDFGTVDGTGTISLTTSTFPAGDYSAFTADGGGSVVFGSGSFTLPTRSEYNNLSITTSGTKTLPNTNLTINGDVTLSAGALTNTSFNRNMNIRGDWTNNASFTAGTGTITFDGIAAQSISGSTSTSFHNVVIDNSDINGVSLDQTATIAGNLTLTSGTFSLNANSLTVSGNITNNASASALDEGTSTVTLNGSSIQTIGGSQDITFNNLTLNNSSATGINMSTSITVNGTLTFTDGDLNTSSSDITLGASGSVSGETSDHYAVGTLFATRNVGTGTSNFGNIGFEIANSGNNLGNVTVKRVTGPGGIVTISGFESIARRWVVTPDNNISGSRNVIFSWLSADDNGSDLTAFTIFQRPTEGSGDFSFTENYQDASARSLNITLTSFSEFGGFDDESSLPVELVSFTGAPLFSEFGARIEWVTATEYENFGFTLYRWLAEHNEPSSDTVWAEVAFVEGQGTSFQERVYEYLDTSVEAAGRYLYMLEQTDFDGRTEIFGPIEVLIQAPAIFDLKQNYPNPFNPMTTVEYLLASDEEVRLEVFDISGKKIATLVEGPQLAGKHSVQFDASGLASGVYIVRMVAANQLFIKKMTVLK